MSMPSNADAEPGSCEIIKPPLTLKAKVRELTGKDAKRDMIAEAEQALQDLSGSFVDWMTEEIDKLTSSWDAAVSSKFDDESRDELFRSAHDLKGTSATLGFPLAGDVASSLCNLLENTDVSSTGPQHLMRQHVNALKAIYAEDARDTTNKIGQRLSEELSRAAQELIDATGTKSAPA